MEAILGLENEIVEKVCGEIEEAVVPANYNCPGQIVISGSNEGIEKACEALKAAGAKRALPLPVGGGFHSTMMESAKAELEAAINETSFSSPICPIYQNVDANAYTDADKIKSNLIQQLTGAVKWTQTSENMLAAGANHFTEVGPGKVLQGLIKKVDRKVETLSA